VSLLFWDSFDHYATGDVLEKYTSETTGAGCSYAISSGRNSTSGLRVTGYLSEYSRVRGPVSSSPDVVTAGFAFYVGDMPSSYRQIFGFLDGTTHQIIILLENDGSLSVYRGNYAALLTNSGPIIKQDTWYYLEIQTTIDNAAGTVEIRLNEEVVVDISGVDTQVSGTAQVTQFEFGGRSVVSSTYFSTYFDDFYLLDDAGAQCNDFLGDVRVCMTLPEGAGVHADWTPLVGANWQEVDDNPPDGDTTYNATNTVTDRDSFEMEDLPGGLAGTVHAHCVAINSRRDDAVAHELEPSVRVGGTDYDGAAELVTDAYKFYNLYAWELNPDIAGAWTVAAVNGAEAGYELTV